MTKRKIVFLTTTLVTLSGMGLLWFLLVAPRTPIPGEVQKQFSFPLYYPGQLPNQWKIDKKSFNTTSGNVLLYKAIDTVDKNKAISITVQERPDEFNFDVFYKQTLGDSTQFTTSLGQAAIGKGPHDFKIGSLTTEQTWILMSSTSTKVSQSDVRILLSSLVQAK